MVRDTKWSQSNPIMQIDAVCTEEEQFTMANFDVQQVNKRVNYKPHFVSAVDPNTVRNIQIEFFKRKKSASTVIAGSIAAILTLDAVFNFERMLMIVMTTIMAFCCWKIYKSLCQCPNCSVSLVASNRNWRMPTKGFSSQICPRCETRLIAEPGPEKLSDAQARKIVHQQ